MLADNNPIRNICVYSSIKILLLSQFPSLTVNICRLSTTHIITLKKKGGKRIRYILAI